MFGIKFNLLKSLTVLSVVAGSIANVIVAGGSSVSIITALSAIGAAVGVRNAIAKNGNSQ